MLIKTFITTAAAMALLSGAALAQTGGQAQPASPPAQAQAPAATPPASGGVQVTSTVDASGTTIRTFTNGPVPDTAENRKRFPPLSATGRSTKPQGK